MTLGKVPLRGLLIYVKNNASIRTYMHSSRTLTLRGMLVHMKDNASS